MKTTREGNKFNETHRECTKCGEWFERIGKDTMRICKTCNTERVKCKSPESKMLARAKARAKSRGIEFDLSLDDIYIPELCPIMNLKLEVHKGKLQKNSPSLDRIDPAKGYVKGNVWVVSSLANSIKGQATPEELSTFINYYISIGTA